VSKEAFLELKCNISSQTNYMMQGLSEVRPPSSSRCAPPPPTSAH